MLEAVIFDLDNTLIDWSKDTGDWLETGKSALDPVHRNLVNDGFSLPPLTVFAETFHKARNQVWDAARRGGWFAPTLTHHFTRTLELLELPTEDVDYAELARLFNWQPVNGVPLYADAEEALVTIKDAGVKLGLLTNASYPMALRDKELEALGIIDYFDVRVATSDIGEAKPNALPFLTVLERLGIRREDAVYIGDSLEQDIAGARNVGMRAIWLIRERTLPKDGIIDPVPDAAVWSLTRALEILDIWYPNWR